MEIQQQLEMVTEQRLLATLQSEDFFLSSEEALDALCASMKALLAH